MSCQQNAFLLITQKLKKDEINTTKHQLESYKSHCNVAVMAPFTCFITSLLHVEGHKLTLWSDNITEGWGRHFEAIFFSPHLQHYISFYLTALLSLFLSLCSLSLTWLFPFNDLQDTYCVFSFRLNFIGKKHTSEHRFNARMRV